MAKKMTNLEILRKGEKLHFKYLEGVDRNRRYAELYHQNMNEEARQNLLHSLDRCSRAYRSFQSFVRRHHILWEGYTLSLDGITINLSQSIEHKAEELFGLYKMNYGISQEARNYFMSHRTEEDKLFWCEAEDDCHHSYQRYKSFCETHGLKPLGMLEVYA